MNELTWVKSSFSNGNGGSNCVEVTVITGDEGVVTYMVRHSKKPRTVLMFTKAEWDAFVEGVMAGEFRF